MGDSHNVSSNNLLLANEILEEGCEATNPIASSRLYALHSLKQAVDSLNTMNTTRLDSLFTTELSHSIPNDPSSIPSQPVLLSSTGITEHNHPKTAPLTLQGSNIPHHNQSNSKTHTVGSSIISDAEVKAFMRGEVRVTNGSHTALNESHLPLESPDTSTQFSPSRCRTQSTPDISTLGHELLFIPPHSSSAKSATPGEIETCDEILPLSSNPKQFHNVLNSGLHPSSIRRPPGSCERISPGFAQRVCTDTANTSESADDGYSLEEVFLKSAMPQLEMKPSIQPSAVINEQDPDDGSPYVGMRLAHPLSADAAVKVDSISNPNQLNEKKANFSRPFLSAPLMANMNDQMLTEIPLDSVTDNNQIRSVSPVPSPIPGTFSSTVGQHPQHSVVTNSITNAIQNSESSQLGLKGPQLQRRSVPATTKACVNPSSSEIPPRSSMPSVNDGLSSGGSEGNSPTYSPTQSRPRSAYFPSSSLAFQPHNYPPHLHHHHHHGCPQHSAQQNSASLASNTGPFMGKKSVSTPRLSTNHFTTPHLPTCHNHPAFHQQMSQPQPPHGQVKGQCSLPANQGNHPVSRNSFDGSCTQLPNMHNNEFVSIGRSPTSGATPICNMLHADNSTQDDSVWIKRREPVESVCGNGLGSNAATPVNPDHSNGSLHRHADQVESVSRAMSVTPTDLCNGNSQLNKAVSGNSNCVRKTSLRSNFPEKPQPCFQQHRCSLPKRTEVSHSSSCRKPADKMPISRSKQQQPQSPNLEAQHWTFPASNTTVYSTSGSENEEFDEDDDDDDESDGEEEDEDEDEISAEERGIDEASMHEIFMSMKETSHCNRVEHRNRLGSCNSIDSNQKNMSHQHKSINHNNNNSIQSGFATSAAACRMGSSTEFTHQKRCPQYRDLSNTAKSSTCANQPQQTIPRCPQSTKTVEAIPYTKRGHKQEANTEGEYESDEDTEGLLKQQYHKDQHVDIPELQQEKAACAKKKKGREVAVRHPDQPSVLIEGVLFRANYLGSTQLVSEGQPSKATRMMQAQEAVGRIKAPDGENQPSVAVDLFVSTEKIMVLNTNLQEIMMDHALRTISYIADIGDILVLMARRRFVPPSTPADESGKDGKSASGMKRQTKIVCHVFESDEAQLIAQSIGHAFQVAYMEFLKANGIDDPQMFKEMDYQEVLNQQEIYAEELHLFADKEMQKEVIVPKSRGEPLGVVIVESGWGSMLPTVVLANMSPSGPAARCGQLNIGNQIMAVNGQSLVGLPLSQCQTMIKTCRTQTSVKLTVVSCPPVVEVLIKRPDVKYQLGFSVQNGVICSLLRGGIAERGGIRVGHRIIEINGQSVVAVAHDKIVNMLATGIGEIHLRTMPTSIFRLLTGQDTPHYI